MGPAEIVRAIYEEGWNRGDFSALERTFADRVPLHIGPRTRDTSLEDLEDIVGQWRAAFPDLHFEIHELLAAGDTVAMRASLRGTQLGEWMGIPPSGNSIDVPHAFFHRFEDGLLAEVWEVLDRDLMRLQLEA